MDGTYPVRIEVDYPDRPLARLSTAFRIFAAIPILIVLSASAAHWVARKVGASADGVALAGGGILFCRPC